MNIPGLRETEKPRLLETALPAVSLQDLAFILFKWKWSIVTIVVVALASTAAFLWLIRGDSYTVTAKLLMKIGLEQAPPSVVAVSPLLVGYRSEDVNSEIDILQSTDLLARVVDRLALDQPPPPGPETLLSRLTYYPRAAASWAGQWLEPVLRSYGLTGESSTNPREEAIERLQDSLSVKAQKDSNVVIAELTLPYREGSAQVMNALLDEYYKFRLSIFQNRSDDFFQSRLEQSRQDLARAEEELQSYETRWRISAHTKQKELLLEEISRASHLLKESELEFQRAVSRVDRLEGELGREEPNFASLGDFDEDSFQQGILSELADLQREREQLRLVELDASPKIQNNRAQYQALSALLAANVRSILAERKASYEARSDVLAKLQADLQELHTRQMEWVRLNRKVESLESVYLLYKRKLEDSSAADLALTQDRIGNVSVIEHGMDPLRPSGTSKTHLLGLAVVAALFAALAFVCVVEFFDHRIYTREALERHLGAPVLGVVPALKRSGSGGPRLLSGGHA